MGDLYLPVVVGNVAVLETAPGRRPVVGHAPAMIRDAFAVMDSARGSDIAVLWLGPKPAYVISHPELIRQLLTSEDRNLDKGPFYESLASLIGVGLGTMIGNEHRARRRLITPAYAPNPELIADCARRLVSSWKSGERYDMAREMRRFSFMVTARTLFADAVSDAEQAEFVDLLPIALVGIAKYMADPTGLVRRMPTRGNRRVRYALDRLQRIIAGAIDTYRAGAGGEGGILAAFADARDPRTGAALDAEAVRNEAMTLMSAGSETVAGVLTHACRLLAQDPDLARRLRDDDTGELTRRVVHELLRLYPAGALMSRRAVVELELGGHRIPAGAALFFCPYLLHRRPELYPDPDRFDPDRWLPDRAGDLPLGAFMPFGAGPHICIGDKIAWQEMTTAVSTISRTVELESVPGVTPRPVLAPTLSLNTVPVIVRERPC